MRISLNWIKKYISDFQYDSLAELTKRMISAGLDIESVEIESEKYKNFVVGQVLECKKHPNADKLTICSVNTGDKIINVVCGAPNVTPGQKVCVALIGAVIPSGEFEIKKSKIRGETSEGMICAEDELGISTDHSGIMVLKENAEVGQSFSDYIGADDILFEIGITPNRGDLFSQIGIAREIAAMFGKKVKLPEIIIRESQEKSSDYISIEILSNEFCKRFTGRVVKNVQIKESPEWLKKALISVGLRPRNNIVDITNFVMMEIGQPLHAFDYDKIKNKRIIVKTAKEGDKFVTLDSKERILNEKSLMVCDGEGYSAIAGIMGGEFSEITSETKNVFIESAYFDPVCVRMNSKKLALQTDASQRFERGVDIDRVAWASDRAAMLMQELAGGEVLHWIIDVYPGQFHKVFVELRKERVEKILGVSLSELDIINLLDKIEIKYFGDKNGKLEFEIPEFRRNDISREIDLIEEVARLYGYENIENQLDFRLDLSANNDYGDLFIDTIKKTKEHLIGRGFNEIITYSQQDEKKISEFSGNLVKIENPNSVEMNVMRVNLHYGMLQSVRNNLNNSGNDISLKLFEIGKVFSNDGDAFKENNILCFALCNKNDFYTFEKDDKLFDFYDIKGELEMLMSKLNIETYGLFYYNTQSSEGQVIEININNIIIGNIIIFNKAVLQSYDIDEDVYLAELNLAHVTDLSETKKYYKEISKFPPVKRDLSIVIGKDIFYKDISGLIYKNGGETLKSVRLFDVYTGEKIGDDKKSMAFSLEFSSVNKTLTDEEVNKSVNTVVKALEKELKAKLRD